MQTRHIAQVNDLPEGATAKFSFRRDGIRVDGFVAHFEGRFVAYENRCRHLPVSLDYGDNQFFTGDRNFLVCQTHGAVYEPATGLCVQGPCAGASLHPLEIEVSDGEIRLAKTNNRTTSQ